MSLINYYDKNLKNEQSTCFGLLVFIIIIGILRLDELDRRIESRVS